MLTIEEYTQQIKTLTINIINKERKNINKFKKNEGWFSDDGYCSDADTFYHIFNYIEHEGGSNPIMNFVNYVNSEDPFNSDVKFKTIKKKKEFFRFVLEEL